MTDKDHEAIEAEITSLYQQGATEVPSTAIDKSILAQARAQIEAQNQAQANTQSQSFWRRYRLPLSSAASVMLVVTLFVINPSMNTGDSIEPSEPMLMSAPEVEDAQPQMMRALPNNAPAASNAQRNKQASVLSLAEQLDSVEKLLADKEIQQAQIQLQQIALQWPEVNDEQSPEHARFEALQKAVMSNH